MSTGLNTDPEVVAALRQPGSDYLAALGGEYVQAATDKISQDFTDPTVLDALNTASASLLSQLPQVVQGSLGISGARTDPTVSEAIPDQLHIIAPAPGGLIGGILQKLSLKNTAFNVALIIGGLAIAVVLGGLAILKYGKKLFKKSAA